MSDPFTGEIISCKDSLERDTIVFIGNRNVLKPQGTFLFAFPYFNRKIRITEQPGLLTPTTGKTTEGRDINREKTPSVCINCLACVDYCPAEIHPSYIYHHIVSENTEEAEKLNIAACILCGKCSFVCPTGLPLYQKIADTLSMLKEELEEKSQ